MHGYDYLFSLRGHLLVFSQNPPVSHLIHISLLCDCTVRACALTLMLL